MVEVCEVRLGTGLGHIEDGDSVSGCASGGFGMGLRAIVGLATCDTGRSFVALVAVEVGREFESHDADEPWCSGDSGGGGGSCCQCWSCLVTLC
jgi:hypothetical protein